MIKLLGEVLIIIAIIFVIILAISFVIGFIQGIKEEMSKSSTQQRESPPNYRPSPWTPEWTRPDYKCNGCEYGHLRKYIKGEFRSYCSKYDIIDNNENYVCDDYIECDLFASFRGSENDFVPFKGHLDHCPYYNK
jgi:hypothetical protein